MSIVNPDYPVLGGILHAPYFIFLRGDSLPTDDEVLDHLFPQSRSWWRGRVRSRAHQQLPVPGDLPLGSEYVYVGEEAGWVLIADDWGYHLWHRKDRQDVLERLAARWELFALRRPDVDESYEFVHFVGGRRIRERRVDSPHYPDRVVAKDFGAKFPCENDFLYAKDPDEIVWTVAEEVGVPRTHVRGTLRRYGRS
jgi:hypothetical protein